MYYKIIIKTYPAYYARSKGLALFATHTPEWEQGLVKESSGSSAWLPPNIAME